MEETFPMVNFHDGQEGFTPVVKISNVFNNKEN
jgi:hypothetical protein